MSVGEMTLEDAAREAAGNWKHFESFCWFCTFPELSASCDPAHEALNEPADFWTQARH